MAEIYAVASGKGGVGKSTFVTGISRELALLGKKALAVDCDIALRSLDILFGKAEEVVYDWGDCVLGLCDPDQLVIKGEADFIAAPRNPDPAFTYENLKKIIDSLAPLYDYVFLDAPAGIGSGFVNAVKCAEKAVVLATPDPVCVRSCGVAAAEAEKLGAKDVKLIINMFEVKPTVKKKLLNLDECIDGALVPLLGVIPLDRALTFISVTGEEADEFMPSTQAFNRIARRLTGERVPLVCE